MKTDEQLKKEAFKKLRNLHREKRPGVRIPIYRDETANDLTTCIVDYINLKGFQAERVHCFGSPIPVKDGLYKMGRTNMHKGTSDIHSVIMGLSVKVEVKAGSDRMSTYQWKYKEEVEQAGGIYIIARSFPQFLKELHQKIKL